MLKEEYKGQLVEIKLPEECGHEGYMVECRYRFDKKVGKYQLSMWLKRDDIDDTFRIDSQEIDTQYIRGTRDSIRGYINRIVEQASSSGFFEPYIERYEYTYRCCEVGMEVLEKERRG